MCRCGLVELGLATARSNVQLASACRAEPLIVLPRNPGQDRSVIEPGFLLTDPLEGIRGNVGGLVAEDQQLVIGGLHLRYDSALRIRGFLYRMFVLLPVGRPRAVAFIRIA